MRSRRWLIQNGRRHRGYSLRRLVRQEVVRRLALLQIRHAGKVQIDVQHARCGAHALMHVPAWRAFRVKCCEIQRNQGIGGGNSPPGSCIENQSACRLYVLMKATSWSVSTWLALIYSARTKRWRAVSEARSTVHRLVFPPRSTHLLVFRKITGVHHHKAYLTGYRASFMSGETRFAKRVASRFQGEAGVEAQAKRRDWGCVSTDGRNPGVERKTPK